MNPAPPMKDRSTPGITRIPRTCLAILGLALGVLSSANSQDEEKAAVKVPLSIFCFDYATGLKSVQVKRGASELAEVKLSTANIVDAGKVETEEGSIRLYGFPEESTKAPAVASAKLGELREPLMILVPTEVGADFAYRSHLVERDPAKFPLGSCVFVNLTPHPVRINLGEEKREIAPGADLLVKPAVAAGEVISVTVECQIGGHWQAVSSSRWAQRVDRRSLVTLHLSPRTGRVQMKSIPLREVVDTP
jgi:hypothetical protein